MTENIHPMRNKAIQINTAQLHIQITSFTYKTDNLHNTMLTIQILIFMLYIFYYFFMQIKLYVQKNMCMLANSFYLKCELKFNLLLDHLEHLNNHLSFRFYQNDGSKI